MSERDYLGQDDLALMLGMRGEVPARHSYAWRRLVADVRRGRIRWAGELSRATGLQLVGKDDGQWVRRVNREQLEGLAGKLGLAGEAREVLVSGGLPEGVGMGLARVRQMGAEVALEVEARYREDFRRYSVRSWVAGVAGSFEGSPWTARKRLPVELGYFWPWAKRLGEARARIPDGGAELLFISAESVTGFCGESGTRHRLNNIPDQSRS